MSQRPPIMIAAVLAWILSASWTTPVTAQLQHHELQPTTSAGVFDQFGAAVAGAGAFVAVSSPYDDQAATAAGRVHLFRRHPAGWVEAASLQAAEPRISAHLGEALDFDGETVLASARGVAPFGVHTFERVERAGGPPTWLPGDVLLPGTSAADFGQDVAVSGPWAAVGVLEEVGRVFLFERVGARWQSRAVLQPAGLQPGDLFGSAVALSGDTLAVGASHSHVGGGDGRVWIFRAGTAEDGGWGLETVLEPNDPPPHGGFGWDIDLDGDRLVVGAFENEDTGGLPGAAYLFERDAAGGWHERAALVAKGDHVPASFGRAVAVDGSLVCVGAFQEPTGPEDQAAGRAYVFRDFAGTWAQVADLRTSAPTEGDQFGRAVTVSGGAVTVGAPGKGLGGQALLYLPLTALGAWVDLGGAVVGHGGLAPQLTGKGPLSGGSLAQLVVSQAAPLADAVLVLGLGTLGSPFQGGVLHPQPDWLLGLTLDGQGRFDASFVWPQGLAPASTLIVQLWVLDAAAAQGWSASNGLQALTP